MATDTAEYGKTWREKLTWASGNYGKASFRGAPFFISNSETGVGRRTEVHVSPQSTEISTNQDYVWAEDLGAEADEFVVEGFVIQNLDNGFDHFPERDKLIQALKVYTNVKKRNVGILVHPFYGKLEVALLGKAKITESLTKDGGIARFQMTFVQYNKPIFKQQVPDPDAVVDQSALDAINDALDSFTALMRTGGNYLSTLTSRISSVMNKMQTAISAVTGAVASTINTALNLVSSSIALIDSVLNAPCDLANLILNACDAIKQIPGMAGDVIQGGIVGGCSGIIRGNQTVLDGVIVPEEIGTSASRNLALQSNYTDASFGQISAEQADNLTLVNNMAQTAMIGNACMISIRTDFSSQDQMLLTLAEVTAALDSLIDRLGAQNDNVSDETLFQSIQKLRADYITSMMNKFSNLAKEYDYKVMPDVESTLTLAYRKYNDLDRADDITYRNKLRHPGFLPSGDNVRLLSE